MTGPVNGNYSSVGSSGLRDIDAVRLWEHLSQFSNSVRTSGSPAELKAFGYAEQVLTTAGYETRLLHHPAFISVPKSARLVCGADELPCISHSMAQSAPSSGLHGLIGWAVDPEADIQGMIALTSGIAGPKAVRDLVRRGAVGAVFINAEHRYEMCCSPIWGSPSASDINELPGIPVVSVSERAAARLAQAVEAQENVSLHATVETGWTEVPLLEATLEAPAGDGSLVLFSGHIDAWHYGAMDNGGANATMLEVAAALADSKDTLQRSLRILFWSGHSHGRYAGSTWYADHHFEELADRAVLHFNIDSVGGKGASVLNQTPCMTEAVPLARKVIKAATGEAYEGNRMERAGDQSFFGHGVSSIFMGLSEQAATEGFAASGFADLFGGGRPGGFGWWWHTPEDTIDKLDPENLLRDARVYLHAIHEACTSTVPPLQYSRTALELHGLLKQYQELAGDLFDLSVAIERALELAVRLEAIEAHWEAKPSSQAWRLMKAVSARLVPLNYVADSVYRHDPALPQVALPRLRAVHELVADAQDPDAVQHHLVGLVRVRNQIEHELREALAVTAAFREAAGLI